MQFIKNNKLLLSLFFAIFLIIVLLAVFTTAKHVPGMSKYTERAYYDLPKGELPPPLMTPEAKLKQRAKVGFIDPIFRERVKEERNGVALPTDILPGSASIPGITDKMFPDVSKMTIPGYGEVPKDSYDELYKEGSPYKLWGRPGRLGEKMRAYASPDDKRKDELGLNDKGYYEPKEDRKNDPSLVPAGSIKVDEPSPEKLKSAFAKILMAIETAKRISENSKPSKPVEGKLEDMSESEKKETKK